MDSLSANIGCAIDIAPFHLPAAKPILVLHSASIDAHVTLPSLAFASFQTSLICTGWPRHAAQVSRSVAPTPLSALRGRVAAVLVGALLAAPDRLGDARLGRADGDVDEDAEGMTTVCGTAPPIGDRAAAVERPVAATHAATSASAAAQMMATPTRTTRRVVIVVSPVI